MPLERIPHDRALRAARRLAEKLGFNLVEPDTTGLLGGIGDADLGLVGSLRRGAPAVHDVDLIAPQPASSGADALYDAVRALFGDTKEAAKNPLFAAQAAPGSEWGRVVSGLNPRFRKLTLEVQLRGAAGDKDPSWAEPFALKLEIHRFTPGPEGDRGWIEMMRTGPGGLGEDTVGWGPMILIRWKQRTGQTSGGLTYADGTAHPTPDEMAVFRAVGIQNWIPPRHRTVEFAKQLATARRTG